MLQFRAASAQLPVKPAVQFSLHWSCHGNGALGLATRGTRIQSMKQLPVLVLDCNGPLITTPALWISFRPATCKPCCKRGCGLM